MTEWEILIPQCFGDEDLVFAGTPTELANAWRLRAEVREADIAPSLLISAIEDWLHAETSNTGQLYDQMARVRAFFDDSAVAT